MLFFELELGQDGKQIDNRYIFQDLKINSCGERYLSKQGNFPVINLSMKSAKQPDYEMAYESIVDEIARDYRRHDYILGTSDLTDTEKERFTAVRDLKAEKIEYLKSFEFLSYCLAKYHRKNVIILLDENDVPLENAYMAWFERKIENTDLSPMFSAMESGDVLLWEGLFPGICWRLSVFTITLKITTLVF